MAKGSVFGYFLRMPASTDKPSVVVICGPTGVGKTATAIQAAQTFHGRIVGADSLQIYRYMDIGTAKPTQAEQAAAPHFMIDIADPDEPYDAARYRREASHVIADAHAARALPLIVGGTGFYIRALTHGLFNAPASDAQVRQKLRAAADVHGLESLYQRLKTEDPPAAAKIHPNDAFRIIRALEVLEVTGLPLSAHHRRHGFTDRPYRVLTIVLNMERPLLYDRIDRRVKHMLAQGLADEVRGLLEKGYGPELKPMQSLGYRHMLDHFAGRLGWREMVATLQRDTRRYAKRQLTYFRADSEAIWCSPGEPESVLRVIEAFLA